MLFKSSLNRKKSLKNSSNPRGNSGLHHFLRDHSVQCSEELVFRQLTHIENSRARGHSTTTWTKCIQLRPPTLPSGQLWTF